MNTRIPPPPNGFPRNVASTSSSPYTDFSPMPPNQPHYQPNMPMPSRLQHHSAHPQHIPHNQWQPPMPTHSSSHPQHHPQHNFNQTSWSHTVQQQQFPPNISNMTGFNMSYLPAQVLQDALSMSAPVEAADEMTLVNALLSSRRKGETYKDGLNSLHGKNGHSASLWKDYYLDHKDRIDAWIASVVQKENKYTPISIPSSAFGRDSHVMTAASKGIPRSSAKPATVKKPSPSSFKVELSPAPSTASAPLKGRKQPSSKQSTPSSIQLPPPTGRRRSTINSLTAPAPVYGDRLPPPNSEIKIPDPPSRSPSPPTRIVPQGRGNKYTQEDRDFFIKFISWHLSKSSELTRLDLCNMLAEKAPHHTAQSWASHWSNNHDLPDKILAAARGDEYSDEEGSESSEEEKIPQRRRPKYRESSTEEEEEDEEEGEDEDEEEEGEEEDDNEPVKEYSESEMGAKGEPFTDADHYIAAKYISTFPNWEDTSSKERWEPFCKKHPQRSSKSWTEYYRRNEKLIGKLIRKIRKQQNDTSASRRASASNGEQARPSHLPSKTKRKLEQDESEDAPAKRGKEDHEDS